MSDKGFKNVNLYLLFSRLSVSFFSVQQLLANPPVPEETSLQICSLIDKYQGLSHEYSSFTATHLTPTLWAGTNSGSIFAYSITIPEEDNRSDSHVVAEVGKELRLRHHAPVVSILILDKNGVPLPNGKDVESGREKAADMSGQHSLLICSEEQFKIFSLPTLRARNKEKLTAIDGSRIRRIAMIKVNGKKGKYRF